MKMVKSRKTLLCAIVLMAVTTGLSNGMMTVLAAAPRPEWNVSLSVQGSHRFLVVENETIRTEFIESLAWMLAKVFHKGVPVISWTGSNGAVVSIDPAATWDRPANQLTWIGSGHGGEVLTSYAVEVDGELHPFRNDLSLKGSEIRLIKTSEMGPFRFNHTVSFDADGKSFTEEHHFTVREGLEWFKFIYAFMHQIAKPLNNWVAWLPDSSTRSGTADKGDGSRCLEVDIRAIAFHSSVHKTGVIVEYEESYPSLNGKDHFFNDRTLDNKLYFRPNIRPQDLQLGGEYVYRAKVIPFQAENENWSEAARLIVDDE